MVGGVDDPSPADDVFFDMGGRRELSTPGAMPPAASGVWLEPPGEPACHERHRPGNASQPTTSFRGAGYLVLIARELTGLSQRRLAERAGTSQPSLAKIESGSRIPTLRSMIRVAAAAGYELVLGLMSADEDPPLADELDMFALLGVLRPDPEDDLAGFVVYREPSVFDGPRDDRRA